MKSIKSFLLAIAAAIIGVLVFLLQAKGKALHKLQVNALREKYYTQLDKESEAVDQAQQKYFAMKKVYEENK